ncbi:MAG: putative DNA binding domain-containing protein [Candidatus Latescibacteria bacterium]|nr:putative DNA binding domain-containing protein [Candidatus Latescibacterota bacterium]
MLKTELIELLRNRENSGIEFKRDDVHPDSLAKEVSALLNLEGGHILLGVEDDGTVTGLTRALKEAEEWVMSVCRNNIQPAIIPYWETLIWENDKVVGAITLPADSPDKPYKAKRGTAWVTFVRVGSTSREASREEEARLYQASHLMRYDVKPVVRTGLEQLDLHRIENYFRDVMRQNVPPSGNKEGWTEILLNTDILTEISRKTMATVGGLLLFGEDPHRYLPQAGITATAYPGREKDYATVDEEILRGPLVSIFSRRGKTLERGVIDRAVDFVARNMGTTAWLEGARRHRKKAYPLEAVREAIVNAVAHRDYTITVTDIEISLYSDRLEVISPGRLPNGVTIQKMKQGYRAARNELLKEILRDYGYVEHRGMGVRNRIVQPMREHNGTEPDLIEEESRFTVRLWKERRET